MSWSFYERRRETQKDKQGKETGIPRNGGAAHSLVGRRVKEGATHQQKNDQEQGQSPFELQGIQGEQRVDGQILETASRNL